MVPAPLRRIVETLAPTIPIDRLRTMSVVLDESLVRERLLAAE